MGWGFSSKIRHKGSAWAKHGKAHGRQGVMVLTNRAIAARARRRRVLAGFMGGVRALFDRLTRK